PVLSTRSNPEALHCSIIVLTAFPPAPPTPMTLIFAPCTTSSSTSSNIVPPDFDIQFLENFFDPLAHPFLHLVIDVVFTIPEDPVALVPASVQHHPHARGVQWVLHHVHQAADPLRNAPAHRQVEDLLGQLRHAFEHRAASG